MADGFLIGSDFLGRIRRVVDGVEAAPERGTPYRIPTRFEDEPQRAAQKTFRICTFTGEWSKNTLKTVTFKYETTTPNTVSATNLFANIAAPAAASNCAIAKEGTAWFLIAAECD